MHGHILVTFRVRAEDGQYAAYCDELGVASCGDTVQDAFHAIEEATLLYLNVIEEGGELERILAEQNIPLLPGEPAEDAAEVVVRARPDEYVSPHAVVIPAAAA